MLAVRSATPSLQRAVNHSAVPRKGAGTGRDHSKALATTLRAAVGAETLCTLHAPLLKSRGLVADCGGFAVTCCVEEEGVGWVIKRSRTGTGFTTLFRLDFQPTAFAVASSGKILVDAPGFINMLDSEGKAITVTVPGLDTAASMGCLDNRRDFEPSTFAADSEGTIAVAGDSHIHIFDCEGDLQYTVAVPGQGSVDCMACLRDGRLLFIVDDTMYMLDLRAAATCKAQVKVLVSHVNPSGGLALIHAANKLLFISSRNCLCELDMEFKECRVITENTSTDGHLCSGTEKSALFISPITPSYMYLTPCSTSGSMGTSTYHSAEQSAINADFCVNSCGDVLFFQPSRSSLTNLCKLPGLVPT